MELFHAVLSCVQQTAHSQRPIGTEDTYMYHNIGLETSSPLLLHRAHIIRNAVRCVLRHWPGIFAQIVQPVHVFLLEALSPLLGVRFTRLARDRLFCKLITWRHARSATIVLTTSLYKFTPKVNLACPITLLHETSTHTQCVCHIHLHVYLIDGVRRHSPDR